MHDVITQGHILVDQKDYLQKVLQCFKLTNAKSVPTPLLEGYHPIPNKGTASSDLCASYQQVIGSLLYIMIGM
jgi:hypothetical protein